MNIEIGQQWKERDGRLNRTVLVVRIDRDAGKIGIRTMDPMTGSTGKLTWAACERFNGKSKGYELIAEKLK